MIECKNVYKRYKSGTNALYDVNMSIEQGEFVYIIGPTGSGKSTLIKMFNAEEVPTKGEVKMIGINVGKLRRRQIPLFRRNIGVVFQDYKLLPAKTVSENVAYALEVIGMRKRQIQMRVKEVLSVVGLEDKGNSFPNQLSGGQQQRVCIARVLATSPKIILLDEPTSALDPISAGKIEDTLYGLKEKYTMLVVTRSMQQASRISNRTGFFLAGDLVEYGNTKEMFMNPQKQETEDYITGKFG